MRVAVLHGYFLADSGSGAYVRQVTKELVRQGHEVTLICQERRPEIYDFIDEIFLLDRTNGSLVPTAGERPRHYAGSCRFVRPELYGRLLVYVDGPFSGFGRAGVKAFQDAPQDWIDTYVSANVQALQTVFAEWPPDVVLANHAIAQPAIARRALDGAAPYVATVHGSELNFSVKRDPRLVPLTVEGLEGATSVVAVSPQSLDDVVSWAAEHDLDLAEKASVLAPGIDTDLFTPATTRAEAISAFRDDVGLPLGFDLDPDDCILAFAGRLMWTKGLQHAIAAMPLLSATCRRVRLLVAGDGPGLGPLRELAALLQEGDLEEARRLTETEPELQTLSDFGDVVPHDYEGSIDWKVAFLGHVTSEKVARMFAVADLSLAPSVFPEAVGLVTVEALSAGALPICAYHSGLASVADTVADAVGDPTLCELVPGTGLTEGIARLGLRQLERYPTSEPPFRRRLHDIAAEHFPSWGDVARHYLELANR